MSHSDFQVAWEVINKHPRLKKLIVPVTIGLSGLALVMVCVMVCAAPYWFTGGAIHNAHLTQNVGLDLNLSGYSWGSRGCIMAGKGDTIKVVVDIHEIDCGTLYVRLNCSGLVNQNEFKSLNINTVGKHTITLVASQSANYHLEFSPRGDMNSALDVVSGGRCDVKYSATWDVL